MKKILFLTGRYNQNGSVYSMLTLINELQAKDYSVLLVIGRHGTAESIEHEFNINSHYIKSYSWITPINKRDDFLTSIKNQMKKILNLWAEITLFHYIKLYNPDIVVMNSSDQYVGIRSCKHLGIPVIMHFREYMTYDHGKDYWSENMAKKYFAKLDGGIAISQDVKQYFSRYPIKNLQVIYNGIDLKKYDVSVNKPRHEEFEISCIGRLCKGKNQLLALKTANLLVKNGISNFHITFYGNDKNEYSDMLKNYIQEEELEEYITFAGIVNDIDEMYGKAHINLLCSMREAFGRVIVEGMLNHCLNVVADKGGAAEIIKDNVNGLLFKSNDEYSLYKILVSAMNNYDELKDVIECGYLDAKEKYSSEKNTRNIELYLKQICKDHKNSVRGG